MGEALLAADSLAVAFPGARVLAPPPPIADLAVVEQAEAWRAYAAEGAALADSVAAGVARLAAASPAPWARMTRAAHGLDAEIACAPAQAGGGPRQGMALPRVSAPPPHPPLRAGVLVVARPPAR